MTYRFGAFAVNADTRQLLREGAEIHLSPKAFELLTLLLANRTRALSKAELQQELWPSTFVEETNLAGLVVEIRRALDDTATDPEFVRTVHRFGYRFIGEVIELATSSPPATKRGRASLVIDDRPIILMQGANVIGREADATIHCDYQGVSRYHARVVVSSDDVTIEDLGSKNGTFVNGQRITTARLSDGDEIRVGTVTLTFVIAPPLSETETVTTER